ncbi:Hypothetical protein PFR_JS13-2_928 [Propionibacterium freudenreichii]|nr:Hypothetical protein PFR_JS11_939 [Propionibacterium freudenreichii]SBN95318.1 Hypothetical protein PFR_JS12-2_934 [Propionibacterium freudenreichii]SCC96904.1 Hypothetical protein PFR_JS12-1_936 [Propionibacterium freudenreichii]SCQ48301.1 Hypothetical protein PFR_JS13-1_939 [Propionibacterium freudenreichii]SCQ52909.1 Hypothetical protein PFR_JS13-2_928 [Propionibacterium freudenreichii]
MMARGSPESRAIIVSAPGTPSPGTVPHSHLKYQLVDNYFACLICVLTRWIARLPKAL